eukprot:gene11486-34200_t
MRPKPRAQPCARAEPRSTWLSISCNLGGKALFQTTYSSTAIRRTKLGRNFPLCMSPAIAFIFIPALLGSALGSGLLGSALLGSAKSQFNAPNAEWATSLEQPNYPYYPTPPSDPNPPPLPPSPPGLPNYPHDPPSPLAPFAPGIPSIPPTPTPLPGSVLQPVVASMDFIVETPDGFSSTCDSESHSMSTAMEAMLLPIGVWDSYLRQYTLCNKWNENYLAVTVRFDDLGAAEALRDALVTNLTYTAMFFYISQLPCNTKLHLQKLGNLTGKNVYFSSDKSDFDYDTRGLDLEKVLEWKSSPQVIPAPVQPPSTPKKSFSPSSATPNSPQPPHTHPSPAIQTTETKYSGSEPALGSLEPLCTYQLPPSTSPFPLPSSAPSAPLSKAPFPPPSPPWAPDMMIKLLVVLLDADFHQVASDPSSLQTVQVDTCKALIQGTGAKACMCNAIHAGSIVTDMWLLASSPDAVDALRNSAELVSANPDPYFTDEYLIKWSASSSNNTGIIVGIVLLIAVLAGCITAIFFLLKDKRQIRAKTNGRNSEDEEIGKHEGATDAPKQRRLSREDPDILKGVPKEGDPKSRTNFDKLFANHEEEEHDDVGPGEGGDTSRADGVVVELADGGEFHTLPGAASTSDAAIIRVSHNKHSLASQQSLHAPSNQGSLQHASSLQSKTSVGRSSSLNHQGSLGGRLTETRSIGRSSQSSNPRHAGTAFANPGSDMAWSGSERSSMPEARTGAAGQGLSPSSSSRYSVGGGGERAGLRTYASARMGEGVDHSTSEGKPPLQTSMSGGAPPPRKLPQLNATESLQKRIETLGSSALPAPAGGAWV